MKFGFLGTGSELSLILESLKESNLNPIHFSRSNCGE